ncbi:Hsp70 family protein [Glycomyces terrestris]|uniref:Hsp70 family protein n=1 Tax=Glycomyces terrestris TaxID=2493553 RepID=A0A426V1F6_9ACTN|nr:Hsp70 family protein [Glycomyces terrestris]RRS00667.1 Hsp70 family protein [Glycomyces terrestris]
MDAAPRSAAALGIDFGTHNTVAAVLRGDGRRHQILFDGHPLLPSGIYLDHDGSLLVGRDAAREARRHPHRYERNPKLRLDSPSLLLGDREVPIGEAVGAVMRRVLSECAAVAGPPRTVQITVPASWGPARRHVVSDAAVAAGAPVPVLLPEPVAAARYFAEVLGHRVEPGRAVVVYDLGAGTFDASAVAATPGGFEVLAVDGSDRVGGSYLDQALVDYLGGRFARTEERAAAWRRLLDPDAGSETLRARFALYDEVREAKERLSRRSTTEVLVPGFAAEELLTRAELELLARPLLAQTVAITKAVMREANLAPEQVAGVFMVGGASRMPLAATMIHQELGIAPTMIEQPELVVGEGAVAVADRPVTPAAPLPPPASTPTAVMPAAYTPASVPAAVPTAGPSGPPTAVIPPAPHPVPPAAIVDAPRSARRPASVPVLVVAVAILLVIASGAIIAELRDRGGAAADDDLATTGDAGEATSSAPETQESSSDPGGSDAGSPSAAADPVFGTVYWDCPQTREYCRDQGGRPGIRGDADDPSSAVGYADVGAVFTLVCFTTADLITPRGDEGEEGYWDYHPGKDASDVMVEVDLGGGETGFIPFVWLVIDPADPNSLGGLAEC